jgi:hypothetical protein
MISEWLQVMLAEISSKKAEAERGRAEEQARLEERSRAGDTASAAEQASAPPHSGTDRAQG